MAGPFYPAGPFYRDMPMLPFTSRMEDGLSETYMIDPNLEAATHSYTEPWNPYVNNNPLLNAMQSRSTGAVTPVQFHRHQSPMSTQSPPADTESSYDHPTTPPDTTMYSPYLQSIALDTFPMNLGGHEFRHMGQGMTMGGFVNLGDVNPPQHHECSDSDHGLGDFKLPPRQYSFDSYPASHCDFELTPAANNHNTTHRLATPDDIPVEQEIEAASASQYPLPPRRSESISSEEDNISVAPSTRRGRDSSEDDEEYQSKRVRSNNGTRANARRNTRTTTTSAPQFSVNIPTLAPSTTQQRRRLTATKPSPTSIPRSLQPSFSCTQQSCQSKTPFASQSDLDAHIKKQHTRPFICVFHFAGCTSTFASKNEWKRHVTTQHLLLTYWLCTEGSCSSSKTSAIFNRKDLFTQHLKRMHCPPHLKKMVMGKGSQENKEWEEGLRVMQQRGVRERCKLPEAMKCPVAGCEADTFEGRDAWDMRMEHVAKHLEKEKGVEFGGANDETLTRWAGSESVGIIVTSGVNGGWELKKPLEKQGNASGRGVTVVVRAPKEEGSSTSQEEGDEEEDAEGEED
ncbi:zinc finger protein ZIC 5 [Cladorrhinum sp. PSN259]|nr:zinc finger protein ZIC 5 [Cladorrhinum sp. PSN259]